jgi:hypothetical protein
LTGARVRLPSIVPAQQAAAAQTQVGHHFLVDPGAACVADVSGGSRFGPDAAKVSGMQARRTEAETIWLWLWRWLFD